MIIQGKYNTIEVFTDIIDETTIHQLETLANQESMKDSIIKIMPDTHAGKGCVIGTTMTMHDKIIPNIVGVDISCGMLCVNLGNIDLDLEKLDTIIHTYIPSGKNVHPGRIIKFEKLQELKCYRNLKDTRRFERAIGTLGGGNHFIEIDTDEENNKYLIIHTGSRNLGKQVAEYYQHLADRDCNYNNFDFENEKNKIIKEYKETNRKQEIQAKIIELKNKYNFNYQRIDKDLAYLEKEHKDEYLFDMKICQEYATLNRKMIAEIIIHKYFDQHFEDFESFETIHNYISFKDNIIRKGAISAYTDEMVLIPLNMKDGCIIGKGKSNKNYNYSAPHGAGRILSRSEAKDQISLTDYKESMEGIYSTSVNEFTIDESCFAYKKKEDIINNITDTIDIIKIIKPIYNFKAS